MVDGSDISSEAEKLLQESGTSFLTVKPDGLAVKSTMPLLLAGRKRYSGLDGIRKFLSESNTDDAKSDARITRTLAVLRELGISRDMSSFQHRLKLQKVIYLLQQYGLQTRWGFNWYLRGPYSPELAHALYESQREEVHNFQLGDRDRKSIETLEKYVDVAKSTPSELEAASAILYIRRAKNGLIRSISDLASEVIEQKPHLSPVLVRKLAKKLCPDLD
ncbi:MAG: hypothetical protein OK439_00290 [Thaumarchaeota archaeon]|nr:hypothetical protein [Nitrososphaerota archaeon]